MELTLGLLPLGFGVSLCALALLIWALVNRQMTIDQSDAAAIFAPGELGHADSEGSGQDSGLKAHHFDPIRFGIDQSSARPVIFRILRRRPSAVIC